MTISRDLTGYVEVLGRHGEVIERQKITALPCRIGRGYDMDILLEDPHMAPAHLEISAIGDQGISARELGSHNGVILTQSKQRFTEGLLQAGEVLRLGRTTLRICPTTMKVAAELPLRSGRFSQQIRKPLTAAILLILVEIFFIFLSDASQLTNSGHLEQISSAVRFFLVIAAMVATGGLLSRIFSRVANLAAHTSLISMALLAASGLEELAAILFFAFAWPGIEQVNIALESIVMGWALYQLIGLISRAGRKVRWSAVLLLLLIRAVVMPGWEMLKNQEKQVTKINTLFRPTSLLLAPGEDPQEFIARAQEIRQRLKSEKN